MTSFILDLNQSTSRLTSSESWRWSCSLAQPLKLPAGTTVELQKVVLSEDSLGLISIDETNNHLEFQFVYWMCDAGPNNTPSTLAISTIPSDLPNGMPARDAQTPWPAAVHLGDIGNVNRDSDATNVTFYPSWDSPNDPPHSQGTNSSRTAPMTSTFSRLYLANGTGDPDDFYIKQTMRVDIPVGSYSASDLASLVTRQLQATTNPRHQQSIHFQPLPYDTAEYPKDIPPWVPTSTLWTQSTNPIFEASTTEPWDHLRQNIYPIGARIMCIPGPEWPGETSHTGALRWSPTTTYDQELRIDLFAFTPNGEPQFELLYGSFHAADRLAVGDRLVFSGLSNIPDATNPNGVNLAAQLCGMPVAIKTIQQNPTSCLVTLDIPDHDYLSVDYTDSPPGYAWRCTFPEHAMPTLPSINIGTSQMALVFDDDRSRFAWQYLHEPFRLGVQSTTSGNKSVDVGDECVGLPYSRYVVERGLNEGGQVSQFTEGPLDAVTGIRIRRWAMDDVSANFLKTLGFSAAQTADDPVAETYGPNLSPNLQRDESGLYETGALISTALASGLPLSDALQSAFVRVGNDLIMEATSTSIMADNEPINTDVGHYVVLTSLPLTPGTTFLSGAGKPYSALGTVTRQFTEAQFLTQVVGETFVLTDDVSVDEIQIAIAKPDMTPATSLKSNNTVQLRITLPEISADV